MASFPENFGGFSPVLSRRSASWEPCPQVKGTYGPVTGFIPDFYTGVDAVRIRINLPFHRACYAAFISKLRGIRHVSSPSNRVQKSSQ